MKNYFLLTLMTLILGSFNTYSQKNSNEVSTFYLIRHAEKDRSNPENRDPVLNQEGMARALKWASVFEDVVFDRIYTTDYKRTRQTAAPTAVKNNMDVLVYDPRTIDVNGLKKDTMGKTVLIVGHSNTTPMLANKLLGAEKYPQMDDADNASLYIITIINSHVTSTVLKID
ncbi:phosphoglycerate mutase family protein [Leptobacterium sp. I13]|uniref:phosphoglycerate mutase family protein n=1 Tax=Leptobacterium meishanense TaxID=3128904 RepID=UPI0030EC1BAD